MSRNINVIWEKFSLELKQYHYFNRINFREIKFREFKNLWNIAYKLSRIMKQFAKIYEINFREFRYC